MGTVKARHFRLQRGPVCGLGGVGAWVLAASVVSAAAADAFYTRPALFSTRPDATSMYMQSIDRFGPVGIGIELHPPAFVMKENGKTDKADRIWSGDDVMDLDTYQALKMTLKTVDGNAYLFVEEGGFSDRHPAGWTVPWIVMKRK